MKNILILTFLFLSLVATAQVKYSLVTDAGIITVYNDGSQDTTTTQGLVPKVYEAILTHQNTDAPVATVLNNTLGNISWAYTTTGTYTGTLSGATFTANKTVGEAYLQARGSNPRTYVLGRASDAGVTLTAMNSSLAATDPSSTNNVFVRILVYQ